MIELPLIECARCLGYHLRGNAKFCHHDKGCQYCNRMNGRRKCKRHAS